MFSSAGACRVLYDPVRKPAISVLFMKHRPRPEEQDDLLRPCLIDMIDGRHELVKVGGADRLGGVRTGVDGFLSVWQGAACDGAAGGGWAAVSAACLSAVRRGGGRPLG